MNERDPGDAKCYHKALYGGGLSQAEEAERTRVAGICELEGAHVLNQLAHLVRAARG